MATYQNAGQGGIGQLLRMIQEEKTQNPALVPPGTEPSDPGRAAVQTPVLNPESPGTQRSVQIRPEGVAGPGVSPVSDNVIRPASIAGGLRIGGEPGAGVTNIDMFNIPQKKEGTVPTATPVEKQATIPITANPAAPAPKSFIQTPTLGLGTKLQGQPLPIQDVEGQTRAASIVDFANKELQNVAQVATTKGFDTPEGQAALDRLQKLDSQLTTLAATAPDYLKKNLQTLSQELGSLRLNAVLQQAQSFREIPAWANDAERAQAQDLINRIMEAEAAKAEYERQLEEERNRGDGGGGDQGQSGGGPGPGQSSQPGPAPVRQTAGRVMGTSNYSSPSRGIGTSLVPGTFGAINAARAARVAQNTDKEKQAAAAGARGDASYERLKKMLQGTKYAIK